MNQTRALRAPRIRLRRATRSLTAYVIALVLVTAATPSAFAILTSNNQISDYVTSTAELSPAEVNAFELQGEFRSFLATAIGPRHVLSAQHVGISLSDAITFNAGPNAGTYSIVTWFDDPGSDLRIIEIDGTLPAWAALNFPSNEAGQQVVIFGRGGPGTGTVIENGELKGWTTGPTTGALSWGRNIITGTSGPNLIRASFDNNGLPREAGFSTGDSGGGWFLLDAANTPRLAGITFSTSGPFQFDVGGSPSGAPFSAALFDLGGLWEGGIGTATFLANNPLNFPGSGFATRISDRISWIQTIVPLGEPDTDSDSIPDSQDNCPFVANADQEDSGSVGFNSPADGIGDACQCGDVSGDGFITSADGFFVKRYGLGLNPFVFNEPDNCDVTGEGKCTGSDGGVITAIAAGLPTPAFGQHCVNAKP